ncbi:type I-G CRISPR-associated RAMP protein Csb1/Cas7g [Paludibaculum fermentans]|uniref:type I-G CRISPR-associated RAMP protein Csb1/Cas7g n=1 Tax=Paludibaculum fermentans TaxID=1473598 RepID=UPI003EB7DCAC
MSDYSCLLPLTQAPRVLFSVALQPVQGDRFQPTGFPSLGAATYQTRQGLKLLVESSQSMANRLEAACWDSTLNSPVAELEGISHITATRAGRFLTDSMLEAHRINSPYFLEGKDRKFFEALKSDLGGLSAGPIDRKRLAQVLFKYDVGCLIHGAFLAKKDLAGGRLRVARSLSSFIEASGVSAAPSGGVKNDHVNPSGDTKSGFGNVPFSRDEFVADQIDCFFNLDLAQIRGYGLNLDETNLLILLALHRIRRLLDSELRLRTACDLEVRTDRPMVIRPVEFQLPELPVLIEAVISAIGKCRASMTHSTVAFEDELRKGKRAGLDIEEPDNEPDDPDSDLD